MAPSLNNLLDLRPQKQLFTVPNLQAYLDFQKMSKIDEFMIKTISLASLETGDLRC